MRDAGRNAEVKAAWAATEEKWREVAAAAAAPVARVEAAAAPVARVEAAAAAATVCSGPQPQTMEDICSNTFALIKDICDSKYAKTDHWIQTFRDDV